MDLITNKAMRVAELAMDGLSARSNAISSNIANVNTPGYVRSDVTFEAQLKKVIDSEDNLKQAKIKNSMEVMQNFLNPKIPYEKDFNNIENYTAQRKSSYNSYNPSYIQSNSGMVNPDGNNVSIEQEMSELNKTGTRYTALATLQSKLYQEMAEIIKTGGSR